MGKAKTLLILIIIVALIAGAWFWLFQKPSLRDENSKLKQVWVGEGINIENPQNNFNELLKYSSGKLETASQKIIEFSEKASNPEIRLAGKYYSGFFEVGKKIKDLENIDKQLSTAEACDSLPKYEEYNQISEEIPNLMNEINAAALELQEISPEFSKENNINETGPELKTYSEGLSKQTLLLESLQKACGAKT